MEARLHDGDAHKQLLHLAEEALDVLARPHAQIRCGAPVQLPDCAQRRQTRHCSRRHPQRLLPRLEQQIRGLRISSDWPMFEERQVMSLMQEMQGTLPAKTMQHDGLTRAEGEQPSLSTWTHECRTVHCIMLLRVSEKGPRKR